MSGAADSMGGAGLSGEADDAEQEASRKEWLQYYMQTSEWQKASELVVTDAEREDLEYLREREERVSRAADTSGHQHLAA